MTPSASFDILGTCFHFNPAITHIQKILSRIPSLSVPSPSSSPSPPSNPNITASSLFHSWFYAAQRDFTYLSMNNSYTPIIQILGHTFRRAAWIVGVPDVENNITKEDIEDLMGLMRNLPAREGLAECFEVLRGKGWDVLAVTNGGGEGTMKYFEAAGIKLQKDDILSCDETEGDGGKGVAKPDGRVYQRTNEVLDRRGSGGHGGSGQEGAREKGRRWFVAAHGWDLIAARKAGFRTAWVAHEEGDACRELFGEFDVCAKDLKECADMMLVMDGR